MEIEFKTFESEAEYILEQVRNLTDKENDDERYGVALILHDGDDTMMFQTNMSDGLLLQCFDQIVQRKKAEFERMEKIVERADLKETIDA